MTRFPQRLLSRALDQKPIRMERVLAPEQLSSLSKLLFRRSAGSDAGSMLPRPVRTIRGARRMTSAL